MNASANLPTASKLCFDQNLSEAPAATAHLPQRVLHFECFQVRFQDTSCVRITYFRHKHKGVHASEASLRRSPRISQLHMVLRLHPLHNLRANSWGSHLLPARSNPLRRSILMAKDWIRHLTTLLPACTFSAPGHHPGHCGIPRTELECSKLQRPRIINEDVD